MSLSESTVFEKIIAGVIPSPRLFEDEHCIVIADIAPQAPVHLLVLPKKHIASLGEATAEDTFLLGHLLLVANRVAVDKGLSGYTVRVHVGKAGGQEIFHLHLHVLGGGETSFHHG